MKVKFIMPQCLGDTVEVKNYCVPRIGEYVIIDATENTDKKMYKVDEVTYYPCKNEVSVRLGYDL